MGKYVALKNRIKRERRQKVTEFITDNKILVGLMVVFFVGVTYCITIALKILL